MIEYKNIILPSKPEVVEEKGNLGIYEIKGLYPGYGHTLGNAIRRMLLSSIPGAAITKIKINGISHEFDTIKGIKEDVLTITLNLKKLNFKLLTDEPTQTVTLKKSGKGVITQKDLQLPSQVKLSDEDVYIAEITDPNTTLEIEMSVDHGIGFVSQEENTKGSTEIGVIVVDSIFSPIKKAIYEVKDMRVGNKTDFNLLKLTIETNGAITPNEALRAAIDTMIYQLQAMISFKGDVKKEEILSDTEVNATKIIDLKLSASTIETLETSNIKTVGELLQKDESDIKSLKGIGEKTVQDIKNAIAEYGVTLKK